LTAAKVDLKREFEAVSEIVTERQQFVQLASFYRLRFAAFKLRHTANRIIQDILKFWIKVLFAVALLRTRNRL